MDSNIASSETPRDSVPINNITNLSPVTNLTLNLSGLSTSVAGTPNRRISWSNPLPGGDKIGLNLDDLSPSTTDSPTFQDVLPCRTKHKMRRYTRISLPSSNEEDKENSSPKTSSSQPIAIEYEIHSQDSGYSSISKQRSIQSSYSSSFTKVRSIVFACDEDSMETMFQLDTTDDAFELLAVPESMSNLLTKPLSENLKPRNPTPGAKRGKLPIRRCLSMEMGSDSELAMSVSEGTSNSDTYLSSCSVSDETSIDLDSNDKCAFKRPDPPNDYVTSQSKRRKSSPCVEFPPDSPIEETFKFKRSFSETAATIMHAILKSDLQPELIGDGTRSFVLPLVRGRHQDLKSIASDTLARLLRGEYKEKIENYTIVDCRYPYEYDGGHIHGAKNIFTKEDVLETFFNDDMQSIKKNVVIFHCEFSSERAPNLCRFLRNKDREMNQGNYPHLHHPEVYILEGGYKAFFGHYKELCEPQGYKPMKHKDHGFELRHFRAKSKSWGADCKSRVQLRSSSKVSII